jgi:hypothetical protein
VFKTVVVVALAYHLIVPPLQPEADNATVPGPQRLAELAVGAAGMAFIAMLAPLSVPVLAGEDDMTLIL